MTDTSQLADDITVGSIEFLSFPGPETWENFAKVLVGMFDSLSQSEKEKIPQEAFYRKVMHTIFSIVCRKVSIFPEQYGRSDLALVFSSGNTKNGIIFKFKVKDEFETIKDMRNEKYFELMINRDITAWVVHICLDGETICSSQIFQVSE